MEDIRWPCGRFTVADVHVAGTTLLPILTSADRFRTGDPAAPLLDPFMGPLGVAYSIGPPPGERLIDVSDLEQLGLSRRELRRHAHQNLESMLGLVRVHGAPPALMISFGGLESSLLLADGLWDELARQVPGELVIGVPARDAVIVTGSSSRPGVEKARRAVDRVFFAGGPYLLIPDLLVRRQGSWHIWRPAPNVPRQHDRALPRQAPRVPRQRQRY
jgi:uncharacterized protein YtpQ (UPF0354 family)